jgi:cysteinyl-tRNA synthetase
MTLRIHDTLSRTKVEFEPIDPSHVKLYVCGPTVYDYAHIGNARPVVVFDVLVRLLRSFYPKVTYVRNITDVDDKINARAQESGEDIRVITQRTAEAFHADMAALGASPPDVEPRATDHISQMIVMIESLIENGHAYAADGHVLFSVPSMEDYGRLSNLDKREIVAGARVDVAPYKNDPSDFVLWKPSAAELPGWESPWGRGRPGWHIECSAMSREHLGEAFDIHGGGQDLIFPHHENEIAQSKCALGHGAFAKYWMHNGYLMSEGEKMSKSLGNFYTVHELLDEFPGEAIRLVLLQTHYRQPLDFTKSGIAEARRTLDRWYRVITDTNAADEAVPQSIINALGDDLNTPQALAELHKLSNGVNTAAFRAGADFLGLLQQNPDDWFKWQPDSAGQSDGLDDAAIEALIVERKEARAAKDFARSDEIRDGLAAQGVILEDGPAGTTWRRG